MTKAGAIFAASLLASTSAYAQVGMPWPGPGTSHSTGGGGGYVGVNDVQTTKWWYGLRAVSSATRGNNLVNLCTTIVAVDTCVDAVSDATTGALIIPVIGGATCNTSTQPYNVKTLYELNGTGTNLSNSNAAQRATLTTCNGATAGLAFVPGNFYVSGNVTQAQPFEVVWAAQRTGAFTTQSNVFENAASTLQDGYLSSINTAYGFTGSVISFAASDAACHVIQIIHNGASGSYQVDGGTAVTSQNFGASSFSATAITMAGGATSRFPTMTWFEGGFVASGSPISLYSNIHGYGNC